jgi:hypothetical protein
MNKMKVRSVAELVTLTTQAGEIQRVQQRMQ